eukprot:1972643-Alexandrium_andersonii.AAC.1
MSLVEAMRRRAQAAATTAKSHGAAAGTRRHALKPRHAATATRAGATAVTAATDGDGVPGAGRRGRGG